MINKSQYIGPWNLYGNFLMMYTSIAIHPLTELTIPALTIPNYSSIQGYKAKYMWFIVQRKWQAFGTTVLNFQPRKNPSATLSIDSSFPKQLSSKLQTSLNDALDLDLDWLGGDLHDHEKEFLLHQIWRKSPPKCTMPFERYALPSCDWRWVKPGVFFKSLNVQR